MERPDQIVWDLDPGPRVAWKQVITAALLVRDVLKTLGLVSWVKTTGGYGLHVVAPIRPQRDWSECLEFARDVSEAIERTDPIYTTTFAKRGRERKILIDYLRNTVPTPRYAPSHRGRGRERWSRCRWTGNS